MGFLPIDLDCFFCPSTHTDLSSYTTPPSEAAWKTVTYVLDVAMKSFISLQNSTLASDENLPRSIDEPYNNN
jgi:hypothetical protein